MKKGKKESQQIYLKNENCHYLNNQFTGGHLIRIKFDFVFTQYFQSISPMAFKLGHMVTLDGMSDVSQGVIMYKNDFV